MTEYEAVCRTCEWSMPMPKREMAEHIKRVHEFQYDHRVVLEAY